MARRRDDNRFLAVALPHAELLYRVARRLAQNTHEAEELVQETYLKAHKAFARFEEREFGVRPWLLRILHNTFLNRRERALRAPRSAGDSLDRMPAGHASTLPERPADLDYDLLDQEVKAAIDKLPVEFRSVLVLWAIKELTYQEIADVLDIPVGTVMSRLHRARRQLIGELEVLARENRWLPSSEPKR